MGDAIVPEGRRPPGRGCHEGAAGEVPGTNAGQGFPCVSVCSQCDGDGRLPALIRLPAWAVSTGFKRIQETARDSGLFGRSFHDQTSPIRSMRPRGPEGGTSGQREDQGLAKRRQRMGETRSGADH